MFCRVFATMVSRNVYGLHCIGENSKLIYFFVDMYSLFKLAQKFIGYYLSAKSSKGHGVHSPFVYDFIKNVLNTASSPNSFNAIEAVRKQMLQDKTVLEVEDFGAGSYTGRFKKRSIASIAKSALKPKKFGQLMFRLATYYRPVTVIELGTSLGITTAYLATANKQSKVVSLEGAAAVADIAKKNFEQLLIQNIEVVQGNFDEIFLPVLQKNTNIQLVYIDGNHRLEPTIQYFNHLMPAIAQESILVFDDIHWSAEMEKAWEIIKSDQRVLVTIDLFFIGLVFFRNDFKIKQDFVIRF